MIVTLTGTPGTGKTSVAEHLEEFEVIDLKQFVKEKGLGDQRRGEIEVDIEAMTEELKRETEEGNDVLIEGHLSHHFPADYCIVLRCDPEELEERLEKRDYPLQKIQENLEAEAMDVILGEAVQQQEKIIEVDTTGRRAEKVAEEIKSRIREGETGYGEADFSDWL